MSDEDAPPASGVVDSGAVEGGQESSGVDGGGGGAAGDDSGASGMISINVKLLGGNDFVMEVDRHIAVLELKTRIRERTEVEEVSQLAQAVTYVLFVLSVACAVVGSYLI